MVSAQPLLLHNWIAGVLIVLACAAVYFARTPGEEAMMRHRLGAAWNAYAARTRRRLF